MDRKEEIKNEYGKLCVAAGELQYRIEMSKRELHELNVKIENLNTEYSEIIKAEPKPAEAIVETAPEVANG